MSCRGSIPSQWGKKIQYSWLACLLIQWVGLSWDVKNQIISEILRNYDNWLEERLSRSSDTLKGCFMEHWRCRGVLLKTAEKCWRSSSKIHVTSLVPIFWESRPWGLYWLRSSGNSKTMRCEYSFNLARPRLPLGLNFLKTKYPCNRSSMVRYRKQSWSLLLPLNLHNMICLLFKHGLKTIQIIQTNSWYYTFWTG